MRDSTDARREAVVGSLGGRESDHAVRRWAQPKSDKRCGARAVNAAKRAVSFRASLVRAGASLRALRCNQDVKGVAQKNLAG